MTTAILDAPRDDANMLPMKRSNLPAHPPRLAGTELAWDNEGIDLARYFSVLFRRRWLILAIIAGALVSGVLLTLLQTPTYRARSTVQVSREAPKVMDVQQVEPTESSDDAFLATQLALLRSRSLAERVVQRLGLGQNETFLAGGRDINDAVDRPAALSKADGERRAIGIVSRNLAVSPVAGSTIFEIAYDDPNPALAATVANGFAAEFIRSALERKFDASNYAREFLRTRLTGTKQKLETSERELVAYAISQGIVGVSDGNRTETGGGSQSLDSAALAAVDQARIQAQANRIRAEQDWRVAASGATIPQVLSSPTIISLRGARSQLQAEYEQKMGLFTGDFPEMKQMRARISELDKQIGAETAAIRRSIQSSYQVASRQEQSLNAQVARAKSGVLDLRSRSIRYNILQREVDTNRQLYDGLLQRYKEIGVAGGIGASNISVVDQAAVPGSPAKPILWLNLVITLASGIILALAIAFGLETLDTSIKAPDEVEGALGLTLLGNIPMAADVTAEQSLAASRRDELSEAYYSVATALQFVTPSMKMLSLLVTSTRAGEGKSTSSIFLASAFAEAGKRVLLIDGDMRRPTLHRTLGLPSDKGLTALLSGTAKLADVIHPTPRHNLMAMSAGELPPNAAQLLSLGELHAVLEAAAPHFDVVLIDGPPVMGLADAPLLSSEVDATLLVIEAGGPGRRAVRRAIGRLRQAQGRLVGAVLTKFDARQSGYGYAEDYSGYYAYGTQKLTDKRKRA